MKKSIFNKNEKILLNGLGITLGLRQLGLLLVMPFLSAWAIKDLGGTSALAGMAIGIFGLSQGILQIPYGHWSDRIGRRIPLIFGMTIFTIGLVLGFLSENVYILIIARAVQGGGAIAAVVYCWVGDEIPKENRNRAMSILGMAVGISAVLAFTGGTFLTKIMSINQLFLLCAVFSLLSILYIIFFLESDKKSNDLPFDLETYKNALRDPKLIPLYLLGFIVNFCMVSIFYIIPILLNDIMGFDEYWKIFSPSVLVSIVIMRLSSRFADKGRTKEIMILAFIIIMISGSLILLEDLPFLLITTMLFLSSYMTLVTVLPATITKRVSIEISGSVTGMYTTMQSIGSFAGGTIIGILWGIDPKYSIGAFIAIAFAAAFIVTVFFREEK